MYSEIISSDGFLDLHEIEFHDFTQENLLQRCERDVGKNGIKYSVRLDVGVKWRRTEVERVKYFSNDTGSDLFKKLMHEFCCFEFM